MKKLVIALIVTMLVMSNVHPITISYGTASAGAKDSSLNWLADGDLVQLIEDVGKDGIDAPDIGDANYIGGDDALVATAAIRDGFMVTAGNFYSSATSASVVIGDVIYFRVFDNPTLNTSVCYDESPTVTVTGDPQALGGPDLVTTTCIPEPSILLAGLALLLLRRKK